MDGTICHGDSAPNRGISIFCCPSEYMIPSCTWRGHKNSGKCSPGYNSGETEVGSRKLGCKKNHQSACCTWSPMWDKTFAAAVNDDYEVKPMSFNQLPLA